MEELKELAKAAGAEGCRKFNSKQTIQRCCIYVGKGKVEEIKAYSDSLGATVVIFNDELSGAHIRKYRRSSRNKGYRQNNTNS